MEDDTKDYGGMSVGVALGYGGRAVDFLRAVRSFQARERRFGK